MEVDMSEIVSEVQPTMYGVFFEDINFAADGGLYAEMIKNRSFEFAEPKMGWSEPNSDRHSLNNGSGMASVIKYPGESSNHNYLGITVKNDQGYSLINEGFRGMGIKKDALYDLSFMASTSQGSFSGLAVHFLDGEGNIVGGADIPIQAGKDWKKHTAQIKAEATVAKSRLRITFKGTGTFNLDMVSLFPKDTWRGRKNGLRKDLVQLLYDLDPGFLRFPGGCIVEGRTLAKRYQWKKTVGPVADREILVNRWNTEFSHRPTPDYFQSFGIGFFEYFQLSEDLGAEPLPILSCGMACQFNTGELVPMEELDPYVQDALDLIEFANGSLDTPWGKVREEMGHPAPFNLKFIGVGNEQWGPEYIERFKVFEKAIRDKFPQITIVSGSGPFPDGDYFEYGLQELKRLNAQLVDEHYYRGPEWFRKNAARYDDYDRNGPKIFAGEYAAQSVATASPLNRNNWECALSEAAFMTGLERNAEVVHLTSYAPLMAHEEGWQWTPDLIWFNNLESYGTANYYVQKMFSTHRGSHVVPITRNKLPLTGQDQLFASAVKERDSNELFVKLVNTGDMEMATNVKIKGGKVAPRARLIRMQNDQLEAVNSFGEPKNIGPQESEAAMKGNTLPLILPPYSFTVVRIGTK
tara:strand:- start:15891 stop:17798 length:1908 start_codon:yes stop_codon:yes gene_type:complete